MMPEMDGLDLAEHIRSEPWISQSPAAAPDIRRPDWKITARCRALEISACLTKPVRQSELFDALMKAMALWNRPAEVWPPRLKAEDRPRPRDHDTSELRVLLAEDHPVNQKVAVRMLQHQGHTVVVASDGRAGLSKRSRAAASTSSSWTCRCRRWTASRHSGPFASVKR